MKPAHLDRPIGIEPMNSARSVYQE